MRRIIYFMGLVFVCCALCACSTTRGDKAAEVVDANAIYASGSTQTQTFGIGDEDNLVGQDAGPSTGSLGKRSFYFDFNSSAVHDEYLKTLNAHAKYLLRHPKAKVRLEGNTDIRGSREYNIALGQRRADAVSDVLKMDGVPASQIRTLSYGAEKPIALGKNEAAYRLNRRVDLVYEK